jgi:hypothetical protein
MTTERADFRFTVKEGDDGKPWIAFEPSGRQLTSTKGSFGFDLKATTHAAGKSLLTTHHAPNP